jgi:hypothetical protein
LIFSTLPSSSTSIFSSVSSPHRILPLFLIVFALVVRSPTCCAVPPLHLLPPSCCLSLVLLLFVVTSHSLSIVAQRVQASLLHLILFTVRESQKAKQEKAEKEEKRKQSITSIDIYR